MDAANIYQVIGFEIAFYIGQCFPLYGLMARKKKSIFTFILVFLLELGLGFLFQWLSSYLKKNVFPNFTYFTIIRYIIIYLTSILIFYFTVKCRFITAIYAINFGYCFQHVMQYLFQLATLPFKIKMFSISGIIIRTLFLAIYSIIILILNRKRFRLIDENNLKQGSNIIIVSIIGVIITIILNSIAYNIATSNNQIFMVYYVLASSGLAGFLLLLLNIIILDKDVMNTELLLTKKMLHQQKNFFSQEKAVINELNIKGHDLKHKLIAMKNQIKDEEFNELNEVISSYDSFIKTGNETVDVILTAKEIICSKNHIRFTAMVDGKAIDFIKESDIYSLLGNILDNAIEAVSKIEDEKKRVINLSIRKENGFLLISEDNYYIGDIVFENSLPKTTKENKIYHGFGMKSVAIIVEKYRGNLKITAKDGIYKIDIIFAL